MGTHKEGKSIFFFRATWQVSELRSEPRLLESDVPITSELCRRQGPPGLFVLREEPVFWGYKTRNQGYGQLCGPDSGLWAEAEVGDPIQVGESLLGWSESYI